ncbi:hypothetical protein GOODEAATRI_033628 [Goodea atripinnis]|uniref:Uncharacterized protein n=1 Tax=Goodea atripinnis TaxID=208336 RepID=A0ABV0N6A6_9TELE
MCSTLFEEVSRVMLALGKPFQVEGCEVSITSYTQDRSYITSRVWLDVSFQDMTLVHPIYICTLDTEPLLVGQDLLDRLAPLIDCHQGQLWAQVEVPKPLGSSSKPPFAINQVSGLEGPKEPLAKFMPSTETVSHPWCTNAPDHPGNCPSQS